MIQKKIGGYLFILAFMTFTGLNAHEGHNHSLETWLHWIGKFHLILLHFPIALIVMTAVAESLWVWTEHPLFDHAARFMILAAAVFAPITAILGLALSYEQSYEGLSLDLFEWHRYFGILTAGLTILTAILRERYVWGHSQSLKSYYSCLFFLFICINLTGTFGGALTFGLN